LASSHYVYPDVSVTCDERDKTTPKYITYPCLVVEVLSSSTEAYDSSTKTLCERGNKFKLYRRNPCLQEYVLVSAETMAIELFRKVDKNWSLIDYEPGSMVELASIKLTFPIEVVHQVVVPEVVYGNLLIWRELRQDSPIHAIGADIWHGEKRVAVVTPVHCAGWLPSQVHAYVQRTLNLLENEYDFQKFAGQIIEHPEQCPIRPCPLHSSEDV
jgi:Putative restriction endonuclease